MCDMLECLDWSRWTPSVMCPLESDELNIGKDEQQLKHRFIHYNKKINTRINNISDFITTTIAHAQMLLQIPMQKKKGC